MAVSPLWMFLFQIQILRFSFFVSAGQILLHRRMEWLLVTEMKEDNPAIRLIYRDLIANLSQIVESVDDTRFPKNTGRQCFPRLSQRVCGPAENKR